MTSKEQGFDTSTVQLVFGINAIIFVPLATAVLTLLWTRSEFQPLRVREPKLLIVAGAVVIVYILEHAFHYSVYEQLSFSCGAHYICTVFLNPAYGGAFIIRLARLIYDFRSAFERLNLTKDDVKHFDQKNAKNKKTAALDDIIRIANNRNPSISATPSLHSSESSEYVFSTSQKVHKTGWTRKWYLENKRWFAADALLWTWFALIVVLAIPGVIIEIIDPSLDRASDGSCEVAFSKNLFRVLQTLSLVVVIVSLTRSITSVDDDVYFIKKELNIDLTVVSTLVVCFFVFSLAFSGAAFPVATIPVILLLEITFCISVVWPTYRTYHPAYASSKEVVLNGDKDLSSLYGILNNPEAMEVFALHLCKEFSVENLMFWESVERYRTEVLELELELAKEYSISENREQSGLEASVHSATSTRSSSKRKVFQKIWQKAARIYILYVADHAPNQVNLPHKIKTSLLQHFQHHLQRRGDADEDLELQRMENSEINHKLFDDAQVCAFDLMERDSFPRFKNTPEYKTLPSQINVQDSLREEISRNETL